MTDSISEGTDADLKHSRRRKAGFNTEEKKDRLPPHSPDAEQGTLGCCLLDPKTAVSRCAGKIKSVEVFFDIRHQTIYEALVEMIDGGIEVDIITLQQYLKDRKRLEEVGGLIYLTSLPDTVPSAANLDYYLDIVLEKYVLRKMILTCTEAVGRIYDHEGEVDTLLDSVERDILAIRQDTGEIHDPKQLVNESIAKIELCHQRQGAIGGLSTGFPDLDRLTDGLHPGTVIVVVAQTKGGKTSFALNVAEYQVLDEKNPVGVFSLEMTAQMLMMRMLCSRARVNLTSVRDGYLAERDFPKLLHAAGQLNASKLYIDDSSGLSVGQIRARARRMVQQYGIKLIVVDYLQLVEAHDTRKRDSREQEVAAISRGLKAMAKELRVPVIALSQLNEDGKVRESRAIEHDCDLLIELNKDKEADQDDVAVKVTARVKLSRSGPTGPVSLIFLKNYTRFESAAKTSTNETPEERFYD